MQIFNPREIGDMPLFCAGCRAYMLPAYAGQNAKRNQRYQGN